MRIKAHLNPLIETTARKALSVDVYPDVYERLAYHPALFSFMAGALADKIPREVRAGGPIFIHIPKNAGTSIKRFLYKVDPGHLSSRFYALTARPLLESADSFAIIRDPFDRFMSSYDFLIRGGGSHTRIQQPVMRRLAHIRTVDDYLDYLESIGGDWFLSDTSARPQSWYITDLSGRIVIKKLYVLGRETPDLAYALSALGPFPLDHANKTDRFTFTLTHQQTERIRRLYAADVGIYEYLLGGGNGLYGAPLETLSRWRGELCAS
jgi:hypothetical protein